MLPAACRQSVACTGQEFFLKCLFNLLIILSASAPFASLIIKKFQVVEGIYSSFKVCDGKSSVVSSVCDSSSKSQIASVSQASSKRESKSRSVSWSRRVVFSESISICSDDVKSEMSRSERTVSASAIAKRSKIAL